MAGLSCHGQFSACSHAICPADNRRRNYVGCTAPFRLRQILTCGRQQRGSRSVFRFKLKKYHNRGIHHFRSAGRHRIDPGRVLYEFDLTFFSRKFLRALRDSRGSPRRMQPSGRRRIDYWNIDRYGLVASLAQSGQPAGDSGIAGFRCYGNSDSDWRNRRSVGEKAIQQNGKSEGGSTKLSALFVVPPSRGILKSLRPKAVLRTLIGPLLIGLTYIVREANPAEVSWVRKL